MKFYFYEIGRRLKRELRLLSNIPFQQKCGQILQTVFPDLVTTPARSKWEHAGIDHCVLANEEDALTIAIQCKGFEVLDFGHPQLRQCLHSIRSFSESSLSSKRYFLVVNRMVRDETRNTINAALRALVEKGKAEDAQLLDLEAFLEMVFQETQKIVAQLLRDSASD